MLFMINSFLDLLHLSYFNHIFYYVLFHFRFIILYYIYIPLHINIIICMKKNHNKTCNLLSVSPFCCTWLVIRRCSLEEKHISLCMSQLKLFLIFHYLILYCYSLLKKLFGLINLSFIYIYALSIIIYKEIFFFVSTSQNTNLPFKI